jgi:glycine cleavage system H protein
MKDISQLHFPETVRYTPDHEWARAKDSQIVIGITDYAQDQLGDIVFVELPKIGDRFDAGEVFGTVESVKAVSELFMPVSGEVVAVNTSLEESPDRVNAEPYDSGWMVQISPDRPADLETLLDRNSYLFALKG